MATATTVTVYQINPYVLSSTYLPVASPTRGERPTQIIAVPLSADVPPGSMTVPLQTEGSSTTVTSSTGTNPSDVPATGAATSTTNGVVSSSTAIISNADTRQSSITLAGPNTTRVASWEGPATLTGPLTTTGLFNDIGVTGVFIYTEPTYIAAAVTGASNSTSSGAAAATSTTAASSSNTVSTGALAGGIVGAFIGGALLALAAACLLFRRKPKSPRGGAYIEEKQQVYPWDAYIPQSADDGAIRRQVESLYSQIDMHVENYYSNKPAATAPSVDLLGRVNSTHLPDQIATMMASTSTPTPIIKHTFAWVILTQLSPAVKDEPSLLPPEFAHMPPQIVAEKDRKGGARENQATSQAYQYWRVLTAHLMYPRSGTRTSNLDNIPAAKDCIDILSAAFAPWSKGSTAARDHLTSVVKSASDTGLVLMSQPSSFAFPWTNEAKGSSTITTFPAFEKTTDERGNVLQQRQVMIRPKTEAISK